MSYFFSLKNFPLAVLLEQICWQWIFLVFLHLKISLFHLNSWRIFFLNIGVWVNSSFLLAFKNVTASSGLWFLKRETLSNFSFVAREVMQVKLGIWVFSHYFLKNFFLYHTLSFPAWIPMKWIRYLVIFPQVPEGWF